MLQRVTMLEWCLVAWLWFYMLIWRARYTELLMANVCAPVCMCYPLHDSYSQGCVMMLSTISSAASESRVSSQTYASTTVWLTAAVWVRGESLPSSPASSIIPIFGSSLMTGIIERVENQKKKKRVETNLVDPIWKLAGTYLWAQNKFWERARRESWLLKFSACKKSCDSASIRASFACSRQSFLFSFGSFYSSHANSSWEQSKLHRIWPRSEMSRPCLLSYISASVVLFFSFVWKNFENIWP